MSPQGSPPLPPGITGQQSGGALAQYAQGQMGAQQGQQGQPQGSMQLVQSELNKVAMSLQNVAKILATEKPQYLPILKNMATGGAMLMNELRKADSGGQGQQQGSPAQPAEQPQEQPDSAGAAAMAA